MSIYYWIWMYTSILTHPDTHPTTKYAPKYLPYKSGEEFCREEVGDVPGGHHGRPAYGRHCSHQSSVHVQGFKANRQEQTYGTYCLVTKQRGSTAKPGEHKKYNQVQ